MTARSTGPAPPALRCAQVPELRILWWFVASIGSLISPSNFAMYAGNVTENCQTNGSWYNEACGPYGTELLTYAQWKRGGYTAGIAQIDTNIFDSYAASIIDLNERLGAGSDAFFAQFVQAAHQWQSVDPANMEERALAFVYHSCRNMRHEARDNSLTYDQPEKYQDLDANSIARTSAQFMYDTYALQSNTHAHAHTKSPQAVFTAVAGAAASSTRSSRPAVGGCTTWATNSRRAARTRCGARRRRSSA